MKSFAALLLTLASKTLLVDASAQVFDVTKYGARGDGHTDDTDAIRDAIQAAQNKGRGNIVFPRGSYKMGPIKFSKLDSSQMTFTGAKIYMLDKSSFQKQNKDKQKEWILGEQCTGFKIIDGEFIGVGGSWKKPSGKDDRPKMFSMKHMNNFEMNGAVLKQAPHEHIQHTNGDTVKYLNLAFDTDVHENSDGLTLENVTNGKVKNVNITNQDDCLKIAGVCSNVEFDSCSCTGGHGLSLGGSSTLMKVDAIRFYDITMVGMADGARFKITPEAVGHANNITWQKLRMTNVRTPIIVQTDYNKDKVGHSGSFSVGDFYFTDIKSTYDNKTIMGSAGKKYPIKASDSGGRPSAGTIRCTDQTPCKKIHFTDVKIDSDADWICEHAKGDKNSGTRPTGNLNCLSGGRYEEVVV